MLRLPAAILCLRIFLAVTTPQLESLGVTSDCHPAFEKMGIPFRDRRLITDLNRIAERVGMDCFGIVGCWEVNPCLRLAGSTIYIIEVETSLPNVRLLSDSRTII